MTLTDEQRSLLALTLVPDLGPRKLRALLDAFPTAQAALQASGPELLSVSGIGGKLSAAISNAARLEHIEGERRRCAEEGVGLVFRGAPEYPRLLDKLPDAPMLLYVQGTLLPQDALSVAIVGSRDCSPYGERQARQLGGALARSGITVISGLARGIDAAAHRGALEAGGRTIAVCAPGLGHVYPPEHAPLAREIVAQGALLSESAIDRPPLPGLFPQRNRLISGLSLGVVLIDAAAKSGSLHTARHATEQGREVMVIPGQVDRPECAGCLALLRDGATLVRHAQDVLESLGHLPEPMVAPAPARKVRAADDRGISPAPPIVVQQPRELNLSEQQLAVLNAVTAEPQLVDTVVETVQLETSRVLATLTILEMKRLVQRLPGGLVVRV